MNRRSHLPPPQPARAALAPLAQARVRPVCARDLPALQHHLPPEAERQLPDADAAGQGWWALVDRHDQPLACLRLRARIGCPQPRPWFHRGCVVHAAPALGLCHPQPTLLLGHDFTGASELADACWLSPSPPAPAPSDWAPLLWTALLHLAAHRAHHGDTLVAELPGRRDGSGASPFWQALGARLGAPAPSLAKARLGPDWRGPLAALLPHQPVHASFLGPAAMAALGQAATEVAAWRSSLVAAGLTDGRHVTIDDGGPVMQGQIADLPALVHARRVRLRPEPKVEAIGPAAARNATAATAGVTAGPVAGAVTGAAVEPGRDTTRVPVWRPGWLWRPATGQAHLAWGRPVRGGGWQLRDGPTEPEDAWWLPLRARR